MVKKPKKEDITPNIGESLFEDDTNTIPITEDMIRYVHNNTTVDENGNVFSKDPNEQPLLEEDTTNRGQRLLPPPDDPNALLERKTDQDRRNSVLLDTTKDVPERIIKSGLVWPLTSHHNQLLNLTDKEAARMRKNAVSIMRRMNWDRRNNRILSASDQKNITTYHEMMLTKSTMGFERQLQSTEIVQTVNINKNDVQEKQSGATNGIGAFIDKIRGKK